MLHSDGIQYQSSFFINPIFSVSDIDCGYSTQTETFTFSAQLRKPDSYSAHPIFADLNKNQNNADEDQACSITPSTFDNSG